MNEIIALIIVVIIWSIPLILTIGQYRMFNPNESFKDFLRDMKETFVELFKSAFRRNK